MVGSWLRPRPRGLSKVTLPGAHSLMTSDEVGLSLASESGEQRGAPDCAELPLPPLGWGGELLQGPQEPEVVADVDQAVVAEQVASGNEVASAEEPAEYHDLLNKCFASIDALQAKMDQITEKQNEADSVRRAQLNCISERIFQVEKTVEQSRQTQEDAIDKANAVFQKNSYEVSQDRQHLMCAISQVNQNFEEVSCEMSRNTAIVSTTQQGFSQIQVEFERVSQSSGSIAASVVALQQEFLKLQQDAQDGKASYRKLADQLAETRERVAHFTTELGKVQKELQGVGRIHCGGRTSAHAHWDSWQPFSPPAPEILEAFEVHDRVELRPDRSPSRHPFMESSSASSFMPLRSLDKEATGPLPVSVPPCALWGEAQTDGYLPSGLPMRESSTPELPGGYVREDHLWQHDYNNEFSTRVAAPHEKHRSGRGWRAMVTTS
mmetsp:Transcript_833/g.2376  ORF Transcript_833/g.2376 Transcript_833/m.2376 type:complete len:436 (-) Transcript_833:93-1400(-)